MPNLTIHRNETPLTRETYVFDYNPGHFGSYGTRLIYYALETRKTTRHKFKGPAWNSSDERKPHGSQLDRPQVIPVEVLIKLQERLIDEVLSMPLYIGWFNRNHVIRDDMRHIATVRTERDK